MNTSLIFKWRNEKKCNSRRFLSASHSEMAILSGEWKKKISFSVLIFVYINKMMIKTWRHDLHHCLVGLIKMYKRYIYLVFYKFQLTAVVVIFFRFQFDCLLNRIERLLNPYFVDLIHKMGVIFSLYNVIALCISNSLKVLKSNWKSIRKFWLHDCSENTFLILTHTQNYTKLNFMIIEHRTKFLFMRFI